MKTLDERLKNVTYSDLVENQPEDSKTPVEKMNLDSLSYKQWHFVTKGYVVYKMLIPDEMCDEYVEYRSRLTKDHSKKDNFYGGWSYPTPFMNHQPLRSIALCSQMDGALEHIMGQKMALNLALTGFVSTQRNWHSDNYLNPEGLWSNYVAAWIALEDITEDSGPFEFVKGSHKWPVLTRRQLFKYLSPQEQTGAHWPTNTQDSVAAACEEEMKRREVEPEQYLPKKGDVLFWHSNLIHRGSKPHNPDALRRALICHYSGIDIRSKIDMPNVIVDPETNGSYFNLPSSGVDKQ